MLVLQKLSLAKLGLVVGSALTVIGLIAYAWGNATLNLIGLFYGVPVLLGGLALKASELKPTPVDPPTPDEIIALRDQQATPTQDQIRKDVTRYRYGQPVHLTESLERLGLSPTDEERPVLTRLRETAVEGCYTLVLTFASPLLGLETWQDKQPKIEKFFGPGIRAEIHQPQSDQVEVLLIRLPEDT